MKKIFVIALLLVISGCASQVQKGSIQLAYSNYEDRDYQDTLKYISQAENVRDTSQELKAELTFLKAQTYEKMGDYEKAQSLYLYLKEQHKESQYGYLASKRLEQNL
ncbi:tetratricopeptide repeat protein [Idiomarina abyssalis]|uniref:tetratricopeptide repeat protein n=1 Tax=Idiomarina abyssalis TaxID=86102 RepID=UPI003A91757D